MSLLSMSIAGGIMIVVVIIIRALLLDKLPKTTFLLLWGLALLRLLIPFQVSSKASIYNLIPSGGVSPINPVANIPMPAVGVQNTLPMTTITNNTLSPLCVVWIIGTLLTILCFSFLYFRSLRELKTSLPCKNDFIDNWLEKSTLKRNIEVRIFDKIKTPLTYGTIKPIILLPKSINFSEGEKLLSILTHEYIHIKHFDSIKKIIMVLAVSIHWFNPLVWVMFILFNRDIELVCDEKVIKTLGLDMKSNYAYTLVELSEQNSKFSLTTGFSKNALEERVRGIMKHKKITALTVSVTLVLTVGITTVFATSETPTKQIEEYSLDNVETTNDEANVLMSHVDESMGESRYSSDNGKTWQTEEEYQAELPVVEWYTYDEYEAFIAEEKLIMDSMVGESVWNPTDGWYIWTEKMTDEMIAMYEENLEDIKNGMMLSKTVDGTDEVMMSYNPEDIETTRE